MTFSEYRNFIVHAFHKKKKEGEDIELFPFPLLFLARLFTFFLTTMLFIFKNEKYSVFLFWPQFCFILRTSFICNDIKWPVMETMQMNVSEWGQKKKEGAILFPCIVYLATFSAKNLHQNIHTFIRQQCHSYAMNENSSVLP